jgi:hypothetical protein
MNTAMQPLFWRISGQHSGMDAISLLMPDDSGEVPAEFPTDVTIQSRRRSPDPVDVRWSDDDNDLFMTLVDRVMDLSDEAEMVLDLTDDVVQGIIHLVALARFRTPWPGEELEADELNAPRQELEIGDLVALNTSAGFPMAVVVALDSVDATCILLDSIETLTGDTVPDHSVLVMSRLNVLPSYFANSDQGESEVRH